MLTLTDYSIQQIALDSYKSFNIPFNHINWKTFAKKSNIQTKINIYQGFLRNLYFVPKNNYFIKLKIAGGSETLIGDWNNIK